MGNRMTGIIIKGIGGFYYVEAADAVYGCKARGEFRKRGMSPCVGDQAEISLSGDGTGAIEEIKPRKNQFIRPPVANLDQLVIVASTCEPSPNPLVIDKMLALAVDKQIHPLLVISKADLRDSGELVSIYEKSGIDTIVFSTKTGEGIEDIRSALAGKMSAFTGNSGVGKFSLLNCIAPHFQLATGQISQKLGRGRHTTRQVELFALPEGGYVADTPGFSTVDIERYEQIEKESLPYAFPEFIPFLHHCQFTSCAHICEKGCAVLAAVERGEIHPSRHNSYMAMYQEIKDRKEWEKK